MWQMASALWSNECERKKNTYILLGLSSRNRKSTVGTGYMQFTVCYRAPLISRLFWKDLDYS